MKKHQKNPYANSVVPGAKSVTWNGIHSRIPVGILPEFAT
jgi:hypothetical protein